MARNSTGTGFAASAATVNVTDLHLISTNHSQLSGPELPRLNYAQHNGRPYCYVYGYSGHAFGSTRWSDAAVVKGNLCATQGNSSLVPALSWYEPGVYPSEAIFVPRKGAKAPELLEEDDGVVLFDAFDSHSNRTVLVVLDAQTMVEVARVLSPVFMPWPLHAQFYAD
jgi:carotenoid cleavage dioxygenase-like enzyme